MSDPRAIAGIVALVQSRRPDWTEPGIRAAVVRMLGEGWSVERVTDVSLRGAADQVIRTPAALAMSGPHWTDAPRDLPQPTGAGTDECQHPKAACVHGSRVGHCALCRYPDGMPLERRVHGPGYEVLRAIYARLDAKAVTEAWEAPTMDDDRPGDEDPGEEAAS